jgi:TolA-binding protein
MNSAHWRFALPAIALVGVAVTPALAQRPPSPEQRIAILEQQLAASQASAVQLQQRLDSIESQLQQLINQGEVNGHRVSQLESQISTLRNDVNTRLTALEARPVAQAEPSAESAADATTSDSPPVEAKPKPKVQTASASTSTPETPEKATDSTDSVATDPGEDAYSDGFRLWRDGKYDQAITSLRAFIAGFPNHRRVSYAKNLIGRALLDKGQPRPAAEALLANYRSNPKGERAPDSLYYLGQALMQLNQPSQACKAYAELEDVYGSSVRPDLKSLVAKGKADARCS